MLDRDTIVGPLQTSVQRRLDDLARSVDLADREQAADLAAREIPLLVEALRATLATHAPDARGHCPVCRSRTSRLLFRRRGRTPCRAYLAAQLSLGPAIEDVVRPRTKHLRRRRTASLSPLG
ncbi:hypothetical protein [Amycolatopsis thermoflava]|uniref:Uncharacterized protein n=1 Tax=Amycolatopsis thermoflava TaxID=84480 RepID=A0A3N2H2K7_9PSEU|nr:hypothetical protein [Amycolatopsis thermoflava]ROS43127.1 hypothetical protein EDD35_5529 [Amycolatopsis thermoflava]